MPDKKSKTNFKPKLTLPVILVSFFALGLILAVALVKLKIWPTYSPAQTTQVAVLTLSANKKSVQVGDNFTVDLLLDSKNREVAAADFIVSFDPKYINVEKVTTGDYFKYFPINRQAENFVKISGVASYDGKKLVLPKGRGNVAKIKFITIAKTDKTTISVDRDKTIIATEGKNILDPKRITDTYISIK